MLLSGESWGGTQRKERSRALSAHLRGCVSPAPRFGDARDAGSERRTLPLVWGRGEREDTAPPLSIPLPIGRGGGGPPSGLPNQHSQAPAAACHVVPDRPPEGAAPGGSPCMEEGWPGHLYCLISGVLQPHLGPNSAPSPHSHQEEKRNRTKSWTMLRRGASHTKLQSSPQEDTLTSTLLLPFHPPFAPSLVFGSKL
ncbi:uncharacterized protein LOC100927631 isoform X2 [Sarcophilus harrisii]|uniref:uncharacterized protein LOC100927631 isoform X2 n=1 Tax=Sarcophilus harrisii TaxID=9305 RepID=UPI001301A462|nr:uncharacterized protein LOC100927631 isoform X2 [Sarcophilus harrisii]